MGLDSLTDFAASGDEGRARGSGDVEREEMFIARVVLLFRATLSTIVVSLILLFWLFMGDGLLATKHQRRIMSNLVVTGPGASSHRFEGPVG